MKIKQRDIRIRRVFQWFPWKLQGEWRWLSFPYVLEKRKVYASFDENGVNPDECWEKVAWSDATQQRRSVEQKRGMAQEIENKYLEGSFTFKDLFSEVQYISIHVNDTFAYACAESYEIDPYNLLLIKPIYEKYGFDALIAYCSHAYDRTKPIGVTSKYVNFQLAYDEIGEMLKEEECKIDFSLDGN